MKRNLVKTEQLRSSFLSCEKDAETIIRKLFISSDPYSSTLKRLLIINTKDCLDNSNEKYNEIIRNTSIKDLMDEKYVTLVPKVVMTEHEKVKSYVIITFDNFIETSNPEFRDCTIHFDILCHTDYWELGDFKLRPIKIMGIIDGILNNSKLSGIGTLKFAGATELILNEELSGYTLTYVATHGGDDRAEVE